MTAFQVNDIIRASYTAQRLSAGKEYRVVEISENPTPFGNFVSYLLEPIDGGERIWIGNAHLLLSKVN